MSLARLWQQQGKDAEARALLGAIYGWFTAGVDPADLRDAKVLRAALTSRDAGGHVLSPQQCRARFITP
jgi:hypothetical protein